MPEILHRISIDAPADRVRALVTSTDGVGRWWSGRSAEGSTAVGGTFGVYFGDADRPAAVMTMESDTPAEVVWRVLEGPDSWVGTRIAFTLRPRGDAGTTLLFAHSGWREADEFMGGCTTNWGAYLGSLKSGAEGGAFAAYPLGEVSRWD